MPGRTHPIVDYLLRLAGKPRARVAFVPTATGDSSEVLVSMYARFPAERAERSHLALFNRTIDDVDAYLLAQDIIVVGGGNTANMLAVWRVHGVDRALRSAWERGVILTGGSAGSLCWFECGTTDSFNLLRLAAASRWARLPSRQPLPALRRGRAAPAALPSADSRWISGRLRHR